MDAHRILQAMLLSAALVALPACRSVMPWTAEWTKPNGSEAAQQEALRRCRNNTIDDSPRSAGHEIAEAQSRGPMPSYEADLTYVSRFNQCMHRLGWKRR